MSAFVKAAATGLQEIPAVNAVIDGEGPRAAAPAGRPRSRGPLASAGRRFAPLPAPAALRPKQQFDPLPNPPPLRPNLFCPCSSLLVRHQAAGGPATAPPSPAPPTPLTPNPPQKAPT